MFGNVLQILANGCPRNMWKMMADITFIIKRHIFPRNIWKALCVKEMEVGNAAHAENLGISYSHTASGGQLNTELV